MEFVLFLRSYGDFMVGLYALKHHTDKPYTLLASAHLEPLYKAIKQAVDWPLPPVIFIDLGIQKGLLAAFTNKFFFTAQAYKELNLLRKALQQLKKKNPQAVFWVEQYRRKKILELFTGISYKAIHEDSNNNVYDSYLQFFANGKYPHKIVVPNHFANFIVFPDSRLAKKQLPVHFTEVLLQKARMANQNGKIAHFNESYKNFEELIALIKSADTIISADSLPAHIAEYLGRPHLIGYTSKINKEWITPFAKQAKFAVMVNSTKKERIDTDVESTPYFFS